jgi:hypothetical protein
MPTPTHFAAIPSELGQAASLAPVGPLVSPSWRGANLASGGVEARHAAWMEQPVEPRPSPGQLPPRNGVNPRRRGNTYATVARGPLAIPFPHQIVGLLIPLSTRKSAQARYLARTTFPAPHASTLFVDEIDSMLAVGACASFGGRATFHPRHTPHKSTNHMRRLSSTQNDNTQPAAVTRGCFKQCGGGEVFR